MFSEEQGVKVTGVRPVPRLMQAMILVATALIIILGIFPQVGLAIVSPAAAYLYHQFFPCEIVTDLPYIYRCTQSSSISDVDARDP